MKLPILRNEIELLPGGLARVQLTQGQACLIDLADLPLVARYRWHAICCRRRKLWYASTAVYDRGKQLRFQMHQLIAGTIGKGHLALVDHKNGDPLDNRRCNLREATHGQNNANRAAYSTSGFKGVYRSRNGRRWVARIRHEKHRRHLGVYDTPEAAADAYNTAARELFGDFARLNELPDRKAMH